MDEYRMHTAESFSISEVSIWFSHLRCPSRFANSLSSSSEAVSVESQRRSSCFFGTTVGKGIKGQRDKTAPSVVTK